MRSFALCLPDFAGPFQNFGFCGRRPPSSWLTTLKCAPRPAPPPTSGLADGGFRRAGTDWWPRTKTSTELVRTIFLGAPPLFAPCLACLARSAAKSALCATLRCATVAPWQVALCVSSCCLPAQRAPSITLFHSGTRRSVAELAFGIEVVSGGIGNGVDPTAGPSRVGLGSSSVRQRPTSSRPSRTPSSSAAAAAAAAAQQQQGRRRRRRRRQRGGGIEVLRRPRLCGCGARGAAPQRRQGGVLATRARAAGARRPRGKGAQRGDRCRVRWGDSGRARAGRMAPPPAAGSVCQGGRCGRVLGVCSPRCLACGPGMAIGAWHAGWALVWGPWRP